jgi:Xaa-Pro aminopeptidase
MRHNTIPASLFADRRTQFARHMKRGSIAIFHSNDVMPRSGDTHFPFRQDADLFALSGIDQPGTTLVLYPDAALPRHRMMAFMLPDDPLHVIWNGKRYSTREARRISGIPTIYPIDQWQKVMEPLIKKAKAMYLNTDIMADPDRIMSINERRAIALRKLYPGTPILDAQPILRKIMMIKHAEELSLMRRAIDVTGKAFDDVLHTIRPGIREYEVEATITYQLMKHGCHHAFEPIIASGPSACILHYTRNDQLVKRDDLVLLDFGAEYAGMAADMSRTIPASGRFTKRQRALYDAVLRVLLGTTDLMRSGMTMSALNTETGKMIDAELIRLKLVTPTEIRKQDPAAPVRRRYYMHGVSHHLGYDVHDKHLREAPFRSGMVLTCEPGLYIPEERTGIRLENDILITRGKPVNLLAHIPIEAEEIEAIMADR